MNLPSVSEALHECCSYKAPVIMLGPESGLVAYGRLVALSSGSLTIELSEEMRTPVPGQRYCVSLSYRGTPGIFFGSVLEYFPDAPHQLPRLTLEVPAKIEGVEARLTYRVPAIESAGLSVRISSPEGTWEAEPINLSITGILIRFAAGGAPELPMNGSVDVVLRMGKDSVSLAGQVRRREGNQYGIQFPDVVSDQGLCPPPALREIVEALESKWLKAGTR